MKIKHAMIWRMIFSAMMALGLPARAGMFEVENFGSHVSTKELQAVWPVTAGSPVSGLETNELFAGGQAMRFAYSASGNPSTNAVRMTFAANQDWSACNALEITYGGAGKDGHSTNTSDTIFIQLLDEFGDVLGSCQIPGGTRNPPLSTATMDLSDKSAFTNALHGTGLGSVCSIVLGVVA